MKNSLNFEVFLSTLQKTNKKLGYFVDFAKCEQNVQDISIHLHALNFLLGKSDLKDAINTLFRVNKECFKVLNFLIAIRDENENLFDKNLNLIALKDYFNAPQKIYDFFIESGLAEIFMNNKIKNLYDYVFGIEVGLDTNARKNRGGKVMEALIANKFRAENLNFSEQTKTQDLRVYLGSDVKKFDFVIKTNTQIYLIETNFYNVGGSKLNEVARAYIEISQKISHCAGFKFVWITDGQGWLDAENKLEEAYKSVEIYNLANLDDFIRKIKND